MWVPWTRRSQPWAGERGLWPRPGCLPTHTNQPAAPSPPHLLPVTVPTHTPRSLRAAAARTMEVFMSVWGCSAMEGWMAGGRYVPSTSSPLLATTLSWNCVFSST